MSGQFQYKAGKGFRKLVGLILIILAVMPLIAKISALSAIFSKLMLLPGAIVFQAILALAGLWILLKPIVY